jgi:hypothetical protein
MVVGKYLRANINIKETKSTIKKRCCDGAEKEKGGSHP